MTEILNLIVWLWQLYGDNQHDVTEGKRLKYYIKSRKCCHIVDRNFASPVILETKVFSAQVQQ